MSTKGLMNQKQWIPNNESSEKNSDLIKNLNRIMFASITVAMTVLGVLVGQIIIFLLVGLTLGALVIRGVSSASRRVLVDSIGGVDADEDIHARLFNVIDGLCVVSGDQRPSIRLVDSSYPVAVVAVGEDGEGIVAVSADFINQMDRVEVEAVMAHLLWRLRMGHPRLVAYLSSLSSIFSKCGLGTVAQRISERALPQDSVVWADISACQATRFPPALVSALEKSSASHGAVSLGIAESLCFALPAEADSDTARVRKFSNLSVSRPLIAERIAILKEI